MPRLGLIQYRNEGNLGNTIQTYGLMHLVTPDFWVWYDNISFESDGVIICNGWFESLYQKIDTRAKAIFAGIHVTSEPGYTNEQTLEWMRRNRKVVGARDPETAEYLNSVGIEAQFVGCASLLLPRYDGPRKGVVFVDYDSARDLTHWIPATMTWEVKLKKAMHMLSIYRTAEAVYTSRLHVALPCIAVGTPVCVKPDPDIRRFSILESLGVAYNQLATLDVRPLRERFTAFVNAQCSLLGQSDGNHDGSPHPLP